MGIFFHPPPPHMGGKQPHEPRKLVPSITNNPPSEPPYSHNGRDAWLPSVIRANGPPDPHLFTFEGGRQPLEGRKLHPDYLNVVAPDNPPFRHFGRTPEHAITQALSLLYPPPPPFIGGFQPHAPRRLNPSLTDNPPDDPPNTKRVQPIWYDKNFWLIEAKQLSPAIPGQSVDNPPVFKRLPIWYSNYYDRPIEAKQLSPAIPGQSVDAPPPLRRPNLYRATESPPQIPRKFYVPEEVVVVVEKVPFVGAWLSTVLSSWLPPYAPQRRELLNPSLTDNPPDDPPPLTRGLYRPSDSFVPQQRRVSTAAFAVVVDNPPFGKRQIVYVGTDEFALKLRKLLTPPSVDKPPRWRQLIDIIWRSAQPPPPLPQVGAKLNPASLEIVPDNAPLLRTDQISAVYSAQPWPPLPLLGIKINPSLLDNPAPQPPVVPPTTPTGGPARQPRQHYKEHSWHRFGESELTDNEVVALARRLSALRDAQTKKAKAKAAKELEIALAQAAQDERAAKAIRSAIEKARPEVVARLMGADTATLLPEIKFDLTVLTEIMAQLAILMREQMMRRDDEDIEVLLLASM